MTDSYLYKNVLLSIIEIDHACVKILLKYEFYSIFKKVVGLFILNFNKFKIVIFFFL